MLTFIVPLQAPAASKDWELVSALACRSLNSLLKQTNSAFRVLLVCNSPPLGLPDDPKLEVIERDFPLPGPVPESRMANKWLKVRVGLVVARKLAPCHVMVVDADDCVSCRLADYVSEQADAHGWYFGKGYMHDEGASLIYFRPSGFDGVCGTSSIVRVELGDLPTEEQGGRDDNPILRGGHTQIRSEMDALGRPLAELPFTGAVYNLATGENHTGFSLSGWRSKKVLLQKLLRYRFLTTRIRREYGLFEIGNR